MADIVLVQVGYGGKDLPHNHGCLRFGHKLLLNDQVKKFSSIANFRHQIDGFIGLVHFI